MTQNAARVTPLEPVGVRVGDLRRRSGASCGSSSRRTRAVLPAENASVRSPGSTAPGSGSCGSAGTGSLEPGQPQYWRLQGPTFLLEFDNSRNEGTHIHSVWRDFREDFGRDIALRRVAACRRSCARGRFQDCLREPRALVAQPEELDHLVGVLVGLDRLRDPARVRQYVVRQRAAGLDEHVLDRALERQVGEPVAVQMPELALPEPELDAAEPVRVLVTPSQLATSRSIRAPARLHGAF